MDMFLTRHQIRGAYISIHPDIQRVFTRCPEILLRNLGSLMGLDRCIHLRQVTDEL
jgi:hypothetical protein